MVIYVIRDGKLVEKSTLYRHEPVNGFPTPHVSSLEPYESPIDGHEVTSWRERDREMRANNCYDPRDVSRPLRRGREVQAQEAKEVKDASGFEWR